MFYELTEINGRVKQDPAKFVLECETEFNNTVHRAADEILSNLNRSPIVLMSGPSGSGKTTTAKKITSELTRLGITAHNISLDNYFLTVDPATAPRTPEGEIDYESPDCLDLELLNLHFKKLAAGEQIDIPHFSFTQRARKPGKETPMVLGKNEVAIFEGIHALNECITFNHQDAYKLYVSTLADIQDAGTVLVKSPSLRLVRRIVRDSFFRNADPKFTLKIWDNIRRGENENILPYKDSANLTLNTSLPYELSVMRQYADNVYSQLSEANEFFSDFHKVVMAFCRFEDIDASVVPADSILREFIGGSTFEY